MSLPLIDNRIIPTILKQKTQELVIEYLYCLGFEFIDMTVAMEGTTPEYEIFRKKLQVCMGHESYSILARKYPTGRWDIRLIVLIKLLGKKEPYIGLYKRGKHFETVKVQWKQIHNFKTMKIGLEFPEYMNYDDRRTWRIEHTRLLEGKNRTPSEFYLAHKDNITILLPEKYGEKF